MSAEGTRMRAEPDRTGNRMIDSLTTDDRMALLEGSSRGPIEIGITRRSPGDVIETVSFPVSGALSLIVDNGTRVEAATIGREGVEDVHAALGSRVASMTVIGQIEGEAIDVDVDRLEEVFTTGTSFRPLVHAYIEALFVQASMSAACNATHHLDERCARWLLEGHDRVDSDTFLLKQEFLAMMLGVHRPSVSIAAGALQTSGLISYTRGHVTILDREGLEGAACSCYESIRAAYSRLVPLVVPVA